MEELSCAPFEGKPRQIATFAADFVTRARELHFKEKEAATKAKMAMHREPKRTTYRSST